jgi:uncharacterized protein YlbG (UPF0298 family)
VNEIISKKIENFTIQKRRLLVVWLYSFKLLKSLKRFGMVIYASRKMNDGLLEVNVEVIENVDKRSNKLHFVRYTQVSYRPDIEVKF